MTYLWNEESDDSAGLWSTELWTPDLFQRECFTPEELFEGGVNGVFYLPSDLSTLFQDAAGTTPVTGPDQPVGLMLDKSVIQQHPARRNLLTYSEDFSEPWATSNCTVTANQAIAPDGTMTADLLIFTSNYFLYYRKTASFAANTLFTASCYMKQGTMNVLAIRVYDTTWINYAKVILDFSTGLVSTEESNFIVTAASATPVGNDWYRVSISCSNALATPEIFYSLADNGDGTGYIWGAQLEFGASATAYQKVTTGLGDWTPGNHASQTADSKRLMLRSDGGRLRWADYDEIDDVINVAFASAPGVCTVVENRLDGIVVTTGVNIATTPYALPVNDNYGVVIIPGTLSADNLNRLTCYFNQQAGR